MSADRLEQHQQDRIATQIYVPALTTYARNQLAQAANLYNQPRGPLHPTKMYHDNLSITYYNRPNSFARTEDHHGLLLDRLITTEACNDATRNPMFQPMDRFLDDDDRPFFVANGLGRDAIHHVSPNYLPQYHHHDTPLDSLPMRYTSPTSSGASSSRFGSNLSDCELAPFTPPDSNNLIIRSPETSYTDVPRYDVELDGLHREYGLAYPDSCVALHDVQAYADFLDKSSYGDDHPAYGCSAQEGYQPIQCVDDVMEVATPQHLAPHPCESISTSRDVQEAPPVIRRRRAQSNKSITSPHLPSKINKRPSPNSWHPSTQDRSSDDGISSTTTNKSFPCPFAIYGCTSTFGSKNEWKRHVNTQHMRLGFWRCDQCLSDADRKPNDFNRKDLFIQHVRRMHPVLPTRLPKSSKSKPIKGRNQNSVDDRALAEDAVRCYRQLRTPPEESGCLFCEATFQGSAKWDERMEHIGRHMETAKKEGGGPVQPSTWQCDEATEAWLLNEEIVVRQRGGQLVLAEGRAAA